MTVVESAAYLKGLVEGLGIDPDSKDGKLWGKLTELLSDMAHEIEDLQASDMDHADALDEMAEELSYLEELTCDLDTPDDMYDDEDYDEEDDPFCSGDCSACGGCPGEDEEEDEDGESDGEDEDEVLNYDGVMYDVVCPVCGEEITLDEDTLKEGFISCPSCGERLEFDLGEESEDEKE